jgi:hypothetical protein
MALAPEARIGALAEGSKPHPRAIVGQALSPAIRFQQAAPELRSA